MARLFYMMHYPTIEPWDSWWETDINIISLNEDTVKKHWNNGVDERAYENEEGVEEAEKDYSKCNRLGNFDADINASSDTVWIIFSYCHTEADSAEFLYAGNSLDDCLAWCKKERNIDGICSFEKQSEGYIWANNPHYRISDGLWIRQVTLA